MEVGWQSVLGSPDRGDVYLSPHPDDVCFSLAHLARRRQRGHLLTLFPISKYQIESPGRNADEIRAITRERIREDARFAQACGLAPRWLGMPDAQVRGRHAFDEDAVALSGKAADEVRRALLGPMIGRKRVARPWLFCPIGIGGHIDHLATFLFVVQSLDELREHYRIAFYEDLHYASQARMRDDGLGRFADALKGAAVQRFALPLGREEDQKAKLELTGLYESQLTPHLRTIAAFTPAVGGSSAPHEALWILQDEADHRPG